MHERINVPHYYHLHSSLLRVTGDKYISNTKTTILFLSHHSSFFFGILAFLVLWDFLSGDLYEYLHSLLWDPFGNLRVFYWRSMRILAVGSGCRRDKFLLFYDCVEEQETLLTVYPRWTTFRGQPGSLTPPNPCQIWRTARNEIPDIYNSVFDEKNVKCNKMNFMRILKSMSRFHSLRWVPSSSTKPVNPTYSS